MQIVVGQSALTGDFASYTKQFGALELHFELSSVPKQAKLERWRAEAPQGFVWSVAFPAELAALHARVPSAADLASTLQVASCLGAQWLLLQTPPQARPDSRVKQRLREFSQALGQQGHRVAWEPSGLWEARAALEVCSELGLVLASDLSREQVDQGELIYTRLRTRGRGLGENQLLRLLERITDAEQTVVIVDGRGAEQVQRWLKQELAFEDDADVDDAGADDTGVAFEDDTGMASA